MPASTLPAKLRKVQLQSSVDAVCGSAYESGLSDHALRTIVDILTRPNLLDQTSITALVKGLYPAGRVSSDLVCNVVASLGNGRDKPSAPTQNLLLRWLIMIYEVLENPTFISNLYAVLFNMLDMISIRLDDPSSYYRDADDLRASICHLLAIITRRKHVKPFRIQTLYVVSSVFQDRVTESSLPGWSSLGPSETNPLWLASFASTKSITQT